MKYKIYYNGDKVKIPGFVVNMGSTIVPSKHRAEIEAYIDNMDEPELTDNGDGTVTLSFDPIPEEMATWMVESKTVFFNIVRQNIGNCDGSRYERPTKFTVRQTFPYEWDYVQHGVSSDISIPNTLSDRENRHIQINELKSGSITRDISYVYDFQYSNSWSKMRARESANFYLEFYMGIIYFDSDNKPALYKMGKIDIPWCDFTHS